MHEALYYKKERGKRVVCMLCPHGCIIEDGETGRCRGRENRDGTLYAVNYGKTISLGLDPVEKKPLYHFLPGEQILSIAANSCNFNCDFCQNYEISQIPAHTAAITPQNLVELCKHYDCAMVAFTYTEPLTWYEFVLDACNYLHQNNIQTVLVTNGYINPEPLKQLLPVVDAMNIDLKAMSEIFYRSVCGGTLQPVLHTIRSAAAVCHVEITNLLIPGENDSDEDIDALISFVAEVNHCIPLHFSKYFPHYKRETHPTDEASLWHAAEMARAELDFVYLGNIHTNRQTRCPQCDELLIKRDREAHVKLINGCCPACGYPVYGVWH